MKYYKHPTINEYYKVYDDDSYEWYGFNLNSKGWHRPGVYKSWKEWDQYVCKNGLYEMKEISVKELFFEIL